MILRSATLLMLAFITMVGCRQTTDSSAAMDEWGIIKEAIENENYARAELLLRSILEEYSFEGEEESKVYWLYLLGSACHQQQKVVEAELALVEATQLASTTGLSDCWALVSPLLGLASLRMQQGRFVEAERDAHRAVTLNEDCDEKEVDDTVVALTFYGEALQEQRRFDEALPPLFQALEIIATGEASENVPFSRGLYNVGTIYLHKDSFDEAELYLNRARTVLKERGETDTLDMSDVLNGISFILFRRGDCERAFSVLEQAIQVRAQLKPLPDLSLAKMYFDIGNVLECLGDVREEVKHKKIALDAYATHYPPEDATVQMIRKSYEDARETAAEQGSIESN